MRTQEGNDMSDDVTRYYFHQCDGPLVFGESSDGAYVSYTDHRRIVEGLERELIEANTLLGTEHHCYEQAKSRLATLEARQEKPDETS